MPKILISYRRDDSAFPSHMIYQRLVASFDRESVFIDVDTIPPGIDFRDHLIQAVSRCDVLLAIMGNHWLTAQNPDGTLRLADPQDFVRIEIQTALQRGIPVIPVLLGTTKMPAATALPVDLVELAYRNAVEIQPGRDFDNHIESLVERLERLLIDVPDRPDSGSDAETVSLNDRVFREMQILGRGGMGEVWLAFDETLKRQVAIKRIRRELLTNREALRRFIQEARHCAKLDHPNIVRILSIERDASGPFLVLELMEGGSLRQKLNDRKLDLVEALAYLRQLLLALKCAHEAGIIHRDIKPENILLTKSGIPKLGDFGLAWLMDAASDGSPRSHPNTAEGTATYLAPELRQSNEAPSDQSDIYSLGITFFEMITGLHPSRAKQKKVPSSVLPILQRMTISNPNLRYHGVDEALHEVLELERSIELAGRTRSESLSRVNRTVDQGFELISNGAPIDAQSCFERVIAEMPEHDGATTGLLLLNLMRGEMVEAEKRFDALQLTQSNDPVFEKIRNYFAGIPKTTILSATPQIMPFSYLIASLRTGQFTKELVEFDKRTINFGDIGELVVELYQQRMHETGPPEYSDANDGVHAIKLAIPNLKITLSYRLHSTSRGILFPAKLRGIGLTISITGAPMNTYRLTRFLSHNLRTRFHRDEFLDPELAEHFQIDLHESRKQWKLFACQFSEFAAAANRRR